MKLFNILEEQLKKELNFVTDNGELKKWVVIREDKKTIEINADNYIITGVPFYNNENENEFKETLENTLN